MLKKIVVMCVAVVIDVFCLEMPEAGVTYQIIDGTLVKAPDGLQKKGNIQEDKTKKPKTDLGVFALCYKNYQYMSDQASFNQDYLQSVFINLANLPRGTTSCITFVIDDSEKEILPELKNITHICRQFNKFNIPVYINWNGGNLGIQQSRDNLLELVQLFGTKYIFLADSDDILHPNCISTAYHFMEGDDLLYLLLMEYVLLGYLHGRTEYLDMCMKKQLNSDNFRLESFAANSDCYDNHWISIGDKLVVIKKVPDVSNKGNGYLPAMVRHFDHMPVKCGESDGNMLNWYGNVIQAIENVKPISKSTKIDKVTDSINKGDPQYAILTPTDSESFLYFYRLYGKSNSHEVDNEIDDITVLKYFTQIIYFLSRNGVSTEEVTGVLIKEFCPLQNMIDHGVNNFDLYRLLDECSFIKLVVRDRRTL